MRSTEPKKGAMLTRMHSDMWTIHANNTCMMHTVYYIPARTAPPTAFPDRALLARIFELLFQVILLPQAPVVTMR